MKREKSNYVLSRIIEANKEIEIMPSVSLENSNGLIILKDKGMN